MVRYCFLQTNDPKQYKQSMSCELRNVFPKKVDQNSMHGQWFVNQTFNYKITLPPIFYFKPNTQTIICLHKILVRNYLNHTSNLVCGTNSQCFAIQTFAQELSSSYSHFRKECIYNQLSMSKFRQELFTLYKQFKTSHIVNFLAIRTFH